MFEQYARWLEELREYTNRKEPVTCRAGYMPLSAITLEILSAGSDPRPHDGVYIDSWTSMTADLADSLQWLGPELPRWSTPRREASNKPSLMVCWCLWLGRRDRESTTPSGPPSPRVPRHSRRYWIATTRSSPRGATWSRAAATSTMSFTPASESRTCATPWWASAHTVDRIADTSTPSQLPFRCSWATPAACSRPGAMVGDAVDSRPEDPQAAVDLTDGQLVALAERCILERPPTGQYVVWFRLRPGYFLGRDACVTHGAITFYEAQSLATLHLAVATARMHLDAVLAVVGHTDGMWEVLGGDLFFDDSPWGPLIPRWGLKHPLPEPDFYQNDHFVEDLADFTANGHLITADIAERLQPPLRLSAALKDTPRTDAEGTVMAAVRAIEHCNTWIAPTGGLRWYTFIDQYLTDGYTLKVFAWRVVFDVFAAVQQYRPDRTLGASTPPELAAIQKDILLDGGWGTRIDSPKTVAHVATLRGIYADHWLARRLAESDDILTSPATISAAFDEERRRVDVRIQRLTRSRNAAIHGGTLSEAACATITDLASLLAQDALNTSIWATITGRPLEGYATSRADEHRQRITNLKTGGDLANLFTLVSVHARSITNERQRRRRRRRDTVRSQYCCRFFNRENVIFSETFAPASSH